MLLQDGVSQETPIFRIPEGFEPTFFTAFFEWNPAKASVSSSVVLYLEGFVSLGAHCNPEKAG